MSVPNVYKERQADGKEACFVMCDDQGTLFVPGRRRTHHARRCTSKEKFLKFSRNERDSTIFVSRLISFPFVQARHNFSASKMKRSSIKRTASSGQREFVGVYRCGEIFFDQIAG